LKKRTIYKEEPGINKIFLLVLAGKLSLVYTVPEEWLGATKMCCSIPKDYRINIWNNIWRFLKWQNVEVFPAAQCPEI
jgi:hypothetical protein